MVPFESGAINPMQYFEALTKKLGFKEIDFAEFVEIFTNIYNLDYEMPSLIRSLKAAGYRIYIVSNTNPLHAEYLKQAYPDLFAESDAYVTSYEVGAMKPDAKIFEMALSIAEVGCEQAIFIDDNPGYVMAASSLGIKSAQLSHGVTLGRLLLNMLAHEEERKYITRNPSLAQI